MSIAQGVDVWVPYKVWDSANKVWLAGDTPATNHALVVIKDGVLSAATNTPQEVGNGLYRVLLTATEVNGLFTSLGGVSSTADAYIIPVHMLADVNTRSVALTVQYTAWEISADAPKTGDEANHTINVAQANASAGASNSPTEVSALAMPGVYSILLDDDETDGPIDSVYGTSSTDDTVIMPTTFPPDPGRYAVPTSATDTIRQRIVDTLIVRFATILISEGYKTDLGENVVRWLETEVDQDELPHLAWRDDDEDQDRNTVGQTDHMLVIDCKVSAQTEDDLYAARADLIQAMGTDPQLGGLAGDTFPPEELGLAEHMNKKLWTQSYRFRIEYPTDSFDEYSQ